MHELSETRSARKKRMFLRADGALRSFLKGRFAALANCSSLDARLRGHDGAMQFYELSADSIHPPQITRPDSS